MNRKPSWPVNCNPSWPGLTLPSVAARALVDGRVKPGHDGNERAMAEKNGP